MDIYNYTHLASRNNLIPLNLTLKEVFNYLGLGDLNVYEISLIERINKDKMPIRIASSNKNTNGRVIASLELHKEKNLIFNKTSTFTLNNAYKVLTIKNSIKSKIIDVSTNDVFITSKQMYATRKDITKYFRDDLTLDIPF